MLSRSQTKSIFIDELSATRLWSSTGKRQNVILTFTCRRPQSSGRKLVNKINLVRERLLSLLLCLYLTALHPYLQASSNFKFGGCFIQGCMCRA